MNILTIPLAAVGIFTLGLAYAHLNQDEAAEAPAPASAQHSKAEDHHHQDYVPQGKPAAAVVLLSEGVQTLELQRPTKVNVQLQNHAADGTITVKLKADPTLQVLSTQQQWLFSVEQTPVINLPLELMASSDGAHRLHLFMEHISDSGEITPRAVAIQFNVGVDGSIMYSKYDAHAQEPPSVIRLQAKEEIY